MAVSLLSGNATIVWEAQTGPQTEAIMSPYKLTGYGGARGGGKTEAACGRQLYKAVDHGFDHNGIMFRSNLKDFKKIRSWWDDKIRRGLPAVRVGGDQQPNKITFHGGPGRGAKIYLESLDTIRVGDYQGQEFTEISIDEAPTMPNLSYLIDQLRATMRSGAGVNCQMFLTGNPGGPGHGDFKDLFIEPADPKIKYVKGEPYTDPETGVNRIFIASFLQDNMILCEKDPEYVQMLNSIRDPVLRKAWLLGDWSVFIGQAFPFNEHRHVIDECKPPDGSTIYMTFDWGSAAPFSIGWWFIDNDGRFIRFDEWYGSSGVPNQGLYLTDPQIAQGILDREAAMGIYGKTIVRIAGPDCWSKKPNSQGAGQIDATETVFSRFGIYMIKGDAERKVKIKQFRYRMQLPEDKAIRPALLICKNCKDFIRTIPNLVMDETKGGEDINTASEDHVYDEACHILMMNSGDAALETLGMTLGTKGVL